MKTRHIPLPAPPRPDDNDSSGFPDAAELAVLRAWYAGVAVRPAVERYLPSALGDGKSARGVLGRIRRRLVALARAAHRDDLATMLDHPAQERTQQAKAVAQAIDILRTARPREPQIADDIAQWFAQRAVRVLQAYGITTLADLTVRIPRRRQWWKVVPGLGAASAQAIEAFFAAWPALTEKARALIVASRQGPVVPWESISLPHEVDGSEGTFRAPAATCTLDATNDYQAVQTWLALHESPATQRTYRKEAERLILWAIVERGRALSSLTTEDAIAYRAFLRHPTPHGRWVGPVRPRSSPDWRPFNGSLSARSVAHALSILGALFRWLIEQRYVLANPFAGVKVRDATGSNVLDVSHAFSEGEWALVRTIADGLEWSYGWSAAAAQRLRFLLDFGYATGLRASELVGAALGHVETDPRGDYWLRVTGKGKKLARVALPPLAWDALARYLAERGLPVTQLHWRPETPVIGNLEADSAGAAGTSISSVRLWMVMRRFFLLAAKAIEADHAPLAEKLRRASPHWMRHTHATHALGRGAELTTVRDNLRHASVSTTSIYLHSDEVKRARQIGDAFSGRK
ncbi:site-specific recombinase XerD [Paraburkholderia bannensis]|uniref:Site-specific recombinase XerD n=1 Tax=Paraburkholderia bannensis TaxID=765414 RepID=A0A7W9U520_9BURK|nr:MULTISPECIES: site-specific integrase [Paraburkholderia]MBB3262092.1 site-specific recombinase XerD [Paraburkholderia sp. WP4_3_2]MBB6107109.1 site-specific recombinase XerD [Paraburkholderia bannensis]